MGHLQDGVWTHEEQLVEHDGNGAYVKRPSKFRNWVTPRPAKPVRRAQMDSSPNPVATSFMPPPAVHGRIAPSYTGC